MKNIDRKMNKLFQLSVVLTLFTMYSHASCNIINGNMYGDCSNVTYSNKSKGVIKVSGYKNESGIIDGAILSEGSNFDFSGISNGDIIINKNSKAIITGTVDGSIINNGGMVTIKGMVNKVIANAGSTTIDGIVSTSVTGKGEVFYIKGTVVNNRLMK